MINFIFMESWSCWMLRRSGSMILEPACSICMLRAEWIHQLSIFGPRLAIMP